MAKIDQVPEPSDTTLPPVNAANLFAYGGDCPEETEQHQPFEVDEHHSFEVDEGSSRQLPLLQDDFPPASSSFSSMTTESRLMDFTDAAIPSPQEEIRKLAAEFAQSTKAPRVYEVMPRLGGRFRFPCRGLCVTGPPEVDMKFNVCAWMTILSPPAFYFAVCSNDLWQVNPLLPLTTGVLLLATISMLLLTSCTDPGIIPRHSLRLLVDGLEEEVKAAIGCEGMVIDCRAIVRDPALMAQLEPRGYRWCTYCRMVQPPRAKHCRDCDACVLRNDHHCPFVNNCIGQRNYVYFIGFLITLVCLGVSVFSGIFLWLSYYESPAHDEETQISERVRSFLMWALLVPTAILLLAVIGLSVFHTVLICQGRTTREMLTQRAFGEGATLFGFRGQSLVHARKMVRFPSLDV